MPKFISDKEMAVLEAKPSKSFISDEEMLRMEAPQKRGLIEKVMERADAYTGAPVRAAVGSLQKTGVMGSGLLDAGKAFYNQIGDQAETAPTGREIVKNMGVPDTALSDVLPFAYAESGSDSYLPSKGGAMDPTTSGTAGLLTDIALDPSSYVSAGLLSKGLKAAGTAAKASKGANVAAKLAQTGAQLGSSSMLIRQAVKAGKITAKAGEKALEVLSSPETVGAFKTSVQGARAQELENRKGLLSQ